MRETGYLECRKGKENMFVLEELFFNFCFILKKIFFEVVLFYFLMRKRKSTLREKTRTYGDSFNDEMYDSIIDARFKSSQTPTTKDFYKKMWQFPNELKKRQRFIMDRKVSIKKMSYIAVEPRCKSFIDKASQELPKLSPKVLEYALELHLLNKEDINGLILNPNKYSIFFENQNLDSPLTKNALRNLNLTKEQISFPSFQVFSENS